MRLIDADALADSLFEKRKNYPQWVADTIGNMPDAVVRCKECRHGRLYAPNCVDCEYMELAREADWYCADGERKEAST